MDQFTPGNTASKVDLTQLENDISVIRNYLEKKTKKITLIEINAKIDKINEMLKHNGFTGTQQQMYMPDPNLGQFC